MKGCIKMKHQYRAIAPVENRGLTFVAETLDKLDEVVNKSGLGGEFLLQEFVQNTHTYQNIGKKVFVGKVD